jgi:hypothetical protein
MTVISFVAAERRSALRSFSSDRRRPGGTQPPHRNAEYDYKVRATAGAILLERPSRG